MDECEPTTPKVARTPSTSAAMVAAGSEGFESTFTRGSGLPPRAQQSECVRAVCKALVTDCSSSRPSNYLIQHATGSGKTLTLAALARELTKLEDAHANRFSLVVVVTDRKVLDEQVGETLLGYFESLGEADVVDRAETCAHLRELIMQAGAAARPLGPRAARHRCRVVVTTFQKAADRGLGRIEAHKEAELAEPEVDVDAAVVATGAERKRTRSSRARVAILADEAHRSHGHGTTAALHSLLCGGSAQPRHVSYVSFSATPSELALKLFGVQNHQKGRREPFHCYGLREALRDGVCVDVLANYTCAYPKLTLRDRAGRARPLDEALAHARAGEAGMSGSDRTSALVRRARAARAVMMRAKAAALRDFVQQTLARAVAEGQDDPKAMLVVRSRRDCVEYRAQLLRLHDEQVAQVGEPGSRESVGHLQLGGGLRILVSFSGALHADGLTEDAEEDAEQALSQGDLTERSLNRVGDVVSAFRNPGAALLIVCAKLETGFDEPRVCCLCIDRALHGAHAVQVLGRANRAAKGKQVHVLDFVNSAAAIADAFRRFVDATCEPLAEHEQRAELGRRLAYISRQLLEHIADRAPGAVAAHALAMDSADALGAQLGEYTQGCETLGREVLGLPYGYACRVLQELGALAGRSTVESMAPVTEDSSGSAPPTAQHAVDGCQLEGGLSLHVGALTTSFSGAIRVGGVSGGAEAVATYRTQPLSTMLALGLLGSAGSTLPLPAVLKAAQAAAHLSFKASLEASVEAPKGASVSGGLGGFAAAGPSPSSLLGTAGPLSAAELRAAHETLRELAAAGPVSFESGQALLIALNRRSPPSVEALRATKAGLTLRKLIKHEFVPISSLASRLFDIWRGAASAEERRLLRAQSLGATKGAAHADPTRQTALCLLGEGLRASEGRAVAGERGAVAGERGAVGGEGELASRLEAAVFSKFCEGEQTTKGYKVKMRQLAAALRTPRAADIRRKLREGTLTAEGLLELEMADALLSEEEREKKLHKRERELRALEAMSPDRLTEQSGEYKCPECKSIRCSLFHTNSMGAVHLTSVPDMIVHCLDCGHKFTI